MLITAADVAMIARVRRPVVSMWRKRYVGADAFPEPVADGPFDAGHVVAWLSNLPAPSRLRLAAPGRPSGG